jgi:aldehyde:ferredoxin oxidoreductase
MAFGYNGKILRVNLTAGTVRIEDPPDSLYRQYSGGEGFVAHFLLKEVPPHTDPLGPENKLIFAAGVLTGVPVGGCGRHSVGARSPLTGGFGEAEAGGYWGAELKMAGFDAIIVEGKATSPAYLRIEDGRAEIRPAAHLWGLKTLECQNAISQELGDTLVKVAQIGPAGEKLVRFASISNDLDAFAGRTGLGAVMGSKNLKAIACRGHQRLTFADPETVADIGKWVRENAPVNNKSMRDLGTANMVRILSSMGGLPTLNFRHGWFREADRISGETMLKTIFVKRRTCFACPVQCKREVSVTEPYTVDPRYGGPEYETIAALGSNCGISDLKAIARGNELCGAYGMDSISCGMAISFAMECFEQGLLTHKDTGGIGLHFGNAAAMLAMIEQIGRREGLGALLGEGVDSAAKEIKGAEKSLLTIKGQEMSMHDPRLKQGMGMGYAMSPTGADHCHNMHDTAFNARSPILAEMSALGILEPLPIDDLSPAKMRLLVNYSRWMHFLNSAVCCYFVVIYGRIGFERMVRLVRAVTGWNTSLFDLMGIGERAMTMARLFNLREGFTAKDDAIPARFFTPQPDGPLRVAVDAKAFAQAKEDYYAIAGWPSGVPSRGKLLELGIGWAADGTGNP